MPRGTGTLANPDPVLILGIVRLHDYGTFSAAELDFDPDPWNLDWACLGVALLRGWFLILILALTPDSDL